MPSLKLVRVDWLLSCPESKTLKEHRKTNPHRTLDLFQLAPMSPLLRRTKGDVSFHILRFHEGAAVEKYVRLRQVMGLKAGADLAGAIQDLNNAIGISANLTAMGLDATDGSGIVDYALKDLAHFGNPRPMSADDYAKVYQTAL